MKSLRKSLIVPALALALIAIAGLAMGLQGASNEKASGPRFYDVAKQTVQFHDYNESISLTPAQESVFREALSALKAPCCSDQTAFTCCCPCNMAKSWWGLSKHLVANEGYGAAEVKAAVEEWFQFINPDGFSGMACYSGGCNRPFHKDGCGGMKEERLIL